MNFFEEAPSEEGKPIKVQVADFIKKNSITNEEQPMSVPVVVRNV